MKRQDMSDVGGQLHGDRGVTGSSGERAGTTLKPEVLLLVNAGSTAEMRLASWYVSSHLTNSGVCTQQPADAARVLKPQAGPTRQSSRVGSLSRRQGRVLPLCALSRACRNYKCAADRRMMSDMMEGCASEGVHGKQVDVGLMNVWKYSQPIPTVDTV